MYNSIIKEAQAAGTYTSKFDGAVMFKQEVMLEDGTHGEVSARTENKWRPGDAVSYTKSDTQWGTKLKLSKPGQTYGGGGANDDTTKGIIASWAVECAMRAVDVNAPNYEDQVMQYARLALQARAAIKNEVQA